ncbi:MAG: carboxypeptidase-like regulatory domain-containing protein, partial [Gammaproteobacteria bacterium]|nr:carboxypeptidase-like regulatory domain-containing protein [Gammaproteobacteria bacterium]
MRKSTFALLLAASLVLPALAFGQAGDSSIRGTVTDDSGAVLPGVTITAMSPALISPATAVTDGQGTYRLLNLPVGDYALEASLSGFATYRQEGILVRASTNIGVDPVMSISTVQETVTVTAETPMLEISRPGNILTIEGDLQRDLPIQARGNWSDFLEMTPGVNARPFDDGSGRMVYFGHATEHFAHVIQLEGMAAAGYTDSQVTYVGMNADMMEDMSVKTGGAEAKDPMGTGLIINVVTRSGGNDLTASAAYDLQDFDWGTGDEAGSGGFFGDNELPSGFNPFASEKANFEAMGVYDPPEGRAAAAGTPTAHQVRQSDFSLGGPIMRDKAWFFGAYRYADLAARISRGSTDIARLNALSGIPLGGIGTTPVYEEFLNTTKSHQPYAKISAQLSGNHELNVYYQRDTTDNTSNREYDLAHRFLVNTGGNLYGAKMTSVFGASTTGQFTLSYNDKASFVPLDKQPQLGETPLSVTIYSGFSVNDSGTTSNGGRVAALGTGNGSERPARLVLMRADMTRYVDNVAGSHEISFGVYAAPWNTYPSTTVYSLRNGWSSESHTMVDAAGNPTTDLTQVVGTRWFSRNRPGDRNGPVDSLKTLDAQDSDIGV